MKRILRISVIVIIIIYAVICIGFFLAQKKLLFHPRVYAQDYKPNIQTPFEELYFTMPDGVKLHGLLMKPDSSKGLVFYLHGNAGSVFPRADQAGPFLKAGYDFFMPDYRGFGKSGGEIESEEQLYNDVLDIFESMRLRYRDQPIIVYGYSLGSGLATRIAAVYDVEHVLLLAPYYSIIDVKNSHYPFIPSFLVRYPLRSYENYSRIQAPISIFHGTADNLIPYENSLKLAQINRPDTLILLEGQGHNGLPWHDTFLEYVEQNL